MLNLSNVGLNIEHDKIFHSIVYPLTITAITMNLTF
jgi:hypothetical protein